MVWSESAGASENSGYCALKLRYSRASRSTVADFQRLGAVALHVAQRHEDFQRLIFDGLARQPEQRFEHVVGILPVRRGMRELGVVFARRMIDEQVLPDLQAAGQMRLAVGIQAQPRGQQQHVGVRPEHRPRRTGTGHASADRRVEPLQPIRIGEIILHRTVDARQRVVDSWPASRRRAPSAVRRTPRLCRFPRPPDRPRLSRCARRPAPRPCRRGSGTCRRKSRGRARRSSAASQGCPRAAHPPYPDRVSPSPRYRRHRDGSDRK